MNTDIFLIRLIGGKNGLVVPWVTLKLSEPCYQVFMSIERTPKFKNICRRRHYVQGSLKLILYPALS